MILGEKKIPLFNLKTFCHFVGGCSRRTQIFSVDQPSHLTRACQGIPPWSMLKPHSPIQPYSQKGWYSFLIQLVPNSGAWLSTSLTNMMARNQTQVNGLDLVLEAVGLQFLLLLSALWWIRVFCKLPDGRDWLRGKLLLWWAGPCSVNL